MSEHEQLEELARLYPLRGMDPEERRRVEQHLASGCGRCEAALLESLRVAGHLLDAVAPVEPSEEVKQALLDRARSDTAEPASTAPAATRGWRWLPAAAALLVAIGLGAYAQSLRDQSGSLQASLIEERASRQAAEERLREQDSRIATLTAPNARAVTLSGQGDIAGARARAFLDPESRLLTFYVYDLPPLPPGQTYQVWVIVEGTPLSAGTFGVEADGRAELEADVLPALEPDAAVTVAVTVEPLGGVPQPTGPMVLVES